VKIKSLIGVFLVLAVLLSGCISTEDYNANGNTPTDGTSLPDVRIAQSTIDEAVAGCKDKTSWGISLPCVRINYVVGVDVEAAIVLHNGDDAKRMVTLRFKATSEPKFSNEDGVFYDPAPTIASSWVSIGTPSIMLEKMQTEVVRIRLKVPEGYKMDSEYWEFDIEADGQPIFEYEQQLVNVVTDYGETELYVILHQPLFQNNTSSVVITSSIDEFPYVLGYDPDDRTLHLDGLKEAETREMTITYEYPTMVSIAYIQRWLIKML
jgi:hypothetical protein